jgi:hypothetical protein
VVRPGFFKLVGATVVAGAGLAWLAGHTALEAAGPDGRAAARWLATFTVATVLWQVLVYARVGSRQRVGAAVAGPAAGAPRGRHGPTGAVAGATELGRWAGMAAVLPGLAAVWPLAALSGRPLAGAVALLTGALFLGATTDGLLLGHWYLVDRRLSNRPILALANWLIVGVGAAFVSAFLGGERGGRVNQSLSPLLAVPNLTVWLAVGLVLVCALIAGFIRVLVRGGSIQAATGMFYLAVVMALAAEFAAKVYFFPA